MVWKYPYQVEQKGVETCSKPNRGKNAQSYPVGTPEELLLHVPHILSKESHKKEKKIKMMISPREKIKRQANTDIYLDCNNWNRILDTSICNLLQLQHRHVEKIVHFQKKKTHILQSASFQGDRWKFRFNSRRLKSRTGPQGASPRQCLVEPRQLRELSEQLK